MEFSFSSTVCLLSFGEDHRDVGYRFLYIFLYLAQACACTNTRSICMEKKWPQTLNKQKDSDPPQTRFKSILMRK
ncbi:hypothetical protein Avbf_06586 [Armadillidium vulgare]|nr:hypothetical protein Avbf_06586 [Armadillidium vulgare]